jgi:hypothetical protein
MFYVVTKQDLIDLLNDKKKIDDIINYKNKAILIFTGEDVKFYINSRKEDLKDENEQLLSIKNERILNLNEEDIKNIIELAQEYIQQDFTITDIIHNIFELAIEEYIKENLTR